MIPSSILSSTTLERQEFGSEAVNHLLGVWGGLAVYAHCQAIALAQLGINVTLLVPADFIH
jgi:hypothetical protein